MSDIFDEVAEDLRRERAHRLWKRFGPYAIGAALLVVVGVAGFRGWEWHVAQRSAESGDRFAAALALAEAGNHREAQTAFQTLAVDAPRGYETLARFRGASEAAAQDGAQGIAAFDALSRDTSLSATLRDLAALRAGLLELDLPDLAPARARLEPLAQAGNVWRHQAREALAFAALKTDDAAAARRWADDALGDAQVPPGVRSRIQIVQQLLADRAPAD